MFFLSFLRLKRGAARNAYKYSQNLQFREAILYVPIFRTQSRLWCSDKYSNEFAPTKYSIVEVIHFHFNSSLSASDQNLAIEVQEMNRTDSLEKSA